MTYLRILISSETLVVWSLRKTKARQAKGDDVEARMVG